MPPRTIDHAPSPESEQYFLIALLMAALLCVILLWVLPPLAFPSLRFDRLFPDLAANKPAQLGVMVVVGIPFFILSLKTAKVIGRAAFVRLVMTVFGIAGIVAILTLLWSNGTRFNAVLGEVLIAAGVVLTTVGLPTYQAWRQGAGLGCIAGAVTAFVTYSVGNIEGAALAGLAAVLSAVLYLAVTTDFLGVAQGIQSKASTEWQTARYQLVGGFVLIAIAMGLAYFCKVQYLDYVGPPTDLAGYGVMAGLLSMFVFYFGVRNVVRALRRLLGSLVPSAHPNLSTVTKQKVHGSAGYADADRVDAALRDQDHGAGGAPRFRD